MGNQIGWVKDRRAITTVEDLSVVHWKKGKEIKNGTIKYGGCKIYYSNYYCAGLVCGKLKKRKRTQKWENQIVWGQDLEQLLLQRTCLWYTGKKRENQDMGWLRLVGSFKIINLFCKISSLSQGSFAKETYDF